LERSRKIASGSQGKVKDTLQRQTSQSGLKSSEKSGPKCVQSRRRSNLNDGHGRDASRKQASNNYISHANRGKNGAYSCSKNNSATRSDNVTDSDKYCSDSAPVKIGSYELFGTDSESSCDEVAVSKSESNANKKNTVSKTESFATTSTCRKESEITAFPRFVHRTGLKPGYRRSSSIKFDRSRDKTFPPTSPSCTKLAVGAELVTTARNSVSVGLVENRNTIPQESVVITPAGVDSELVLKKAESDTVALRNIPAGGSSKNQTSSDISVLCDTDPSNNVNSETATTILELSPSHVDKIAVALCSVVASNDNGAINGLNLLEANSGKVSDSEVVAFGANSSELEPRNLDNLAVALSSFLASSGVHEDQDVARSNSKFLSADSEDNGAVVSEHALITKPISDASVRTNSLSRQQTDSNYLGDFTTQGVGNSDTPTVCGNAESGSPIRSGSIGNQIIGFPHYLPIRESTPIGDEPLPESENGDQEMSTETNKSQKRQKPDESKHFSTCIWG
jgi:hypothetical protein